MLDRSGGALERGYGTESRNGGEALGGGTAGRRGVRAPAFG